MSNSQTPPCGHSACVQHHIDTGEGRCIAYDLFSVDGRGCYEIERDDDLALYDSDDAAIWSCLRDAVGGNHYARRMIVAALFQIPMEENPCSPSHWAWAWRDAENATQDPNGEKLWACQECGCTDVQEPAWIEMNTGELTGDEAPTDRHYCPQCGDGEAEVDQTADEPKPFDGYPTCYEE